MTEPMDDAELAALRHIHEREGLSLYPPGNTAFDRLFARIDAERTRADAAEAEREKAVARERERCIQIVGDRIMAARLGELDADLRSIGRSVSHAIRNPTAAQEG